MSLTQSLYIKPWLNGLASRCKLAKPELARGLAMGGQTVLFSHVHDSARKFTQVAKFVNFTHIQFTCDHLVTTCVGWPNGEKLRRLAYEQLC